MQKRQGSPQGNSNYVLSGLKQQHFFTLCMILREGLLLCPSEGLHKPYLLQSYLIVIRCPYVLCLQSKIEPKEKGGQEKLTQDKQHVGEDRANE